MQYQRQTMPSQFNGNSRSGPGAASGAEPSVAEALGIPPTRVPSPAELVELAAFSVGAWGSLRVKAAGLPMDGPMILPVEFSMALQGPCAYLFNLRCGQRLAAELAEANTGDPFSRRRAAEAVRALAGQMAERLLNRHLAWPGAVFNPIRTMPTQPEDWPSGGPTVSAAVIVRHAPMELRLWMLPEKRSTVRFRSR